MDVKAYIESGIIESYVFGLAGADERALLEKYALEYPEVGEALNEFIAVSEAFAIKNAIVPPAHLKDRIRESLDFSDGSEHVRTEGHVPPLQSGGGFSLLRFSAIAASLLLAVSIILNFYFFKKSQEFEERYLGLMREKTTLLAETNLLNQRLGTMSEQVKLIGNTSVKAVYLSGVEGKESNSATVYWNAESKEVFIASKGLQPAAAGTQYQLWALVDGKPVDAGIIDDCGTALCKVKNIERAQAFAITLEKKGGSPVPTLTALYVMGKV